MTKIISPENYFMPFGKYLNMRAIDICDIYKVNPKTGKDDPLGLHYLKFLCEKCDWFKHKDIVEQIIKLAEDNMSDLEEEERTDSKRNLRYQLETMRNSLNNW